MAISIHAPIVGCDINPTFSTSFFGVFQSTHPSWGATRSRNRKKRASRNFNPRTHRGVRQCNIIIFLAHFDISIHAPIVGCDGACVFVFFLGSKFQSTHPSWGATQWLEARKDIDHISIHAPIVGCDFSVFRLLNCPRNFNPRTHRGVRLYIRHQQAQNQYISIHAPIVGCDREEMREE